jgi:hypothetical protein
MADYQEIRSGSTRTEVEDTGHQDIREGRRRNEYYP